PIGSNLTSPVPSGPAGSNISGGPIGSNLIAPAPSGPAGSNTGGGPIGSNLTGPGPTPGPSGPGSGPGAGPGAPPGGSPQGSIAEPATAALLGAGIALTGGAVLAQHVRARVRDLLEKWADRK